MGNSYLKSPNSLYIITVYFNPSGSKRRYQLHKEFHARLQSIDNIVLVTAECAFPTSSFEVTSPNKEPLEIQIRSNSIIWIKENLINIALKKLYKNKKFLSDCKYIAWVDADIEFIDVDWFSKLEESLTKYSIVQMFKYALFLDINEEISETHTSFGYYYVTKELQLEKFEYPHPGYAWCTTKKNMIKLQKLYDMGVLGSGDTHMAYALIGEYEQGFMPNLEYEPNFKESVRKWQEKALKIFKKKLGFVNMNIKHFWHGSRQNRQQIYRWQLLNEFEFNPLQDLAVMSDGHYELKQEKKELESKLIEILLTIKSDENGEGDEKIPNEKEGVFSPANYYRKDYLYKYFNSTYFENKKMLANT